MKLKNIGSMVPRKPTTGILLLAILVAVVVALAVSRPIGHDSASAEGPVDLTGSWSISHVDQFGNVGACTAVVTQTGSILSGTITCGVSPGTLLGDVIGSTVVSISTSFPNSYEVDWQGDIISPNKLSGTWSDNLGSSGTFRATRTSPPAPKPTPTPAKLPSPGDADGDGCTDEQENGPNETLGGRRDYLNFWDFYDMDLDGFIGFGDFLELLQHYNSDDNNKQAAINRNSDPLLTPETPLGVYHPRFDRGGTSAPGGDPWDELPPDGEINFFDFLSLLRQYTHSCKP